MWGRRQRDGFHPAEGFVLQLVFILDITRDFVQVLKDVISQPSTNLLGCDDDRFRRIGGPNQVNPTVQGWVAELDQRISLSGRHLVLSNHI